MTKAISVEIIATKILEIRGKRVMLDRDLAQLYGVGTKRLNEQVRRNRGRFPEDFMFRLTEDEKEKVVAICDHLKSLKFSYQLPYVFAEQGVAMLSSVLNSERAIKVNIQIMRAFVKLKALERKYVNHDKKIKAIFDAIKKLLETKVGERKRRIGFRF